MTQLQNAPSRRKIQLAGAMPPVPTPFNAQGDFDGKALYANLQKLSATGLHGFVLLGSNGEYVYLDEAEKAELFQVARDAIPANQLFIAGTGAESTRATLRLTLMAAEAKADAAIVITPCYYKPSMTGEALYQHFTTIADASPIPVILYNMPAYTGVDMTVDTILKLAAHPNIVGLKESSGNIVKISELVQQVTTRQLDFAVLAGSASFLQPTLLMGGTGGVMATANVAPRHCLQIWEAMQIGDIEAARQIQQQVLALNAMVTTRFGVAGLKFAMDELGLYGGPVRSPLLPLAESAKPEIRQAIAQLNLSSL